MGQRSLIEKKAALLGKDYVYFGDYGLIIGELKKYATLEFDIMSKLRIYKDDKVIDCGKNDKVFIQNTGEFCSCKIDNNKIFKWTNGEREVIYSKDELAKLYGKILVDINRVSEEESLLIDVDIFNESPNLVIVKIGKKGRVNSIIKNMQLLIFKEEVTWLAYDRWDKDVTIVLSNKENIVTKLDNVLVDERYAVLIDHRVDL